MVRYMHVNCFRSNFWTAEVVRFERTFHARSSTEAGAVDDLRSQVSNAVRQINQTNRQAPESALAIWDTNKATFQELVKCEWRQGLGFILSCPECDDKRYLPAPDDSKLSLSQKELISEKCEQLYKAHQPMPTADGTLADPSEDLKVVPEHHRVWSFKVTDPNGVTSELSDTWTGSGAAVMEALTPVLNRYAADGWRLVSLSEDKAMYRGHDADREPMPVRIRVLLESDD
jgi:uncharacterized protein YbaR (Trm112 family)